jgi:hypothetical protein
MKEFNKEEYNKMCAEFLGWEYFPESKSGNTWPDGTHNGEYNVFDIWVKNPTEKYRKLLCHSAYEYLGGEYNDEIKKSDLFEDYVYTLKYDSDWNWIMEVVEKIESIGFNFNLIKNGDNYAEIRSSSCYDEKISDSMDLEKEYISKKEAVVQAIWEFLNWYKENKN